MPEDEEPTIGQWPMAIAEDGLTPDVPPGRERLDSTTLEGDGVSQSSHGLSRLVPARSCHCLSHSLFLYFPLKQCHSPVKSTLSSPETRT
jgi:hypothetical protein